MSPRSCVIRMIAAWVCSCAALSTSTICAWIVTSSAVVGSSAIRTLGSFAIAIAIIARWRMPPENSCGYWSTRRSANGTPTRSSSSIVRVRAASSFMPGLCVSSASEIWSPIVNTGFSDVIGSWKIIAISPPRISRSSFFGILSRSLPLVQRLARRRCARAASGSARAPTASTRSCPDPDSPTMPSTSPGCRS